MKIALLMQDTRALNGAEIATLRLFRALRAANVDARAWLLEELRLGTSSPSPLADAFAAAGPVRGFPVRSRLSRPLADALAAAAREDGISVLHSTGYKADLHAVWAARLAPGAFATVSTVHGWLCRPWALKERFYGAVNLFALRRCDRVVALTAYYEGVLRRAGLDPFRITRIPTGLDPSEIASASDGDALWRDSGVPFTFGTLGRLSEEKNIALLLRAAARLARRLEASPAAWRLLVAGDGPLRPALERLARRLGIADRVAFPGRLSPSAFFPRVHVLVQPSRIENLPLSVMEAMAWQRPVLATAVGGVPELVADGSTGELVPSGSPSALASAMAGLLASPSRARDWGRAGRARLAAAFPPSAMLLAHLGLYRALAPSP